MPLLGTRGAASAQGFGLFNQTSTARISSVSTTNGYIWVKDGNFAYNSTSGINYTDLFTAEFSSNAYLVMRSIVIADGSVVVAGSMTRYTGSAFEGKLRVLRSTNKGVSWSAIIDTAWGAYDTFAEVRLIYGNGYYLIAGTNNQYYSTNGSSWTSFTASGVDSRNIGIINTRWIAGSANGGSGNLYKYNDSTIPTTTWTASTSTLNSPYDANNLSYGGASNGLAFGFGAGDPTRATYVYSTDGAAWTGASLPYGYEGKYAGWNNVTSSHWAIFNDTSVGDAKLYTTTNGTSWTLQTTSVTNGGMAPGQYQAWGYMYFSDQTAPLPAAAMYPWVGDSTPPRVYISGSYQNISLSPTMSSLNLYTYQISSISSNKYPYGFQATP